MQSPPKKLLDQVRDAIRLKHYAYRTEETYVHWIRRYIVSIRFNRPGFTQWANVPTSFT
ncbi:MAG: phage integrase N-terminal SAM-like domain-containing protein [Kaiparowitsia implicata GSE-PSE-MK54-09C]|jgi:hypothetical protein|nr:phage integrase N-terminal SAM-like domain-containing protein [Kaiparowitsia implicata GSE-PSE-MK54-09C]